MSYLTVNSGKEQCQNKHQTRDRSLILIISTSFGESLFSRDHVCIQRKIVLKQRWSTLQSIVWDHKNWRAHILKQNSPSPRQIIVLTKLAAGKWIQRPKWHTKPIETSWAHPRPTQGAHKECTDQRLPTRCQKGVGRPPTGLNQAHLSPRAPRRVSNASPVVSVVIS